MIGLRGPGNKLESKMEEYTDITRQQLINFENIINDFSKSLKDDLDKIRDLKHDEVPDEEKIEAVSKVQQYLRTVLEIERNFNDWLVYIINMKVSKDRNHFHRKITELMDNYSERIKELTEIMNDITESIKVEV